MQRCAQLPDQRPEFIGPLGAAGAPGDLRGLGGALVEVGEIRPQIGRRERVGGGIALGASLPLIGGRREQMRERQQHGRDRLRMLLGIGQIEFAFRRQHGLDLVHVHVDGAHQDLAGEDRFLRRRLVLRRCRRRQHGDRQRRNGAGRTRRNRRCNRIVPSLGSTTAYLKSGRFPARGYWR